jgi:hypothetical protein
MCDLNRCAMFGLVVVMCAFHAALGAKQRADDRWESWPEEPIMISPVEGVIESFWHTGLNATRRWQTEDGSLSTTWDSTWFNLATTGTSEVGSMSRQYDIDVSDYRRLRIRLRTGKAVRTSIVATVDGQQQPILSDAAGSDDAFELAGPIRGQKLTRLTITFKADRPGKHRVQLRWIMLETDGPNWTPPEAPFEGMIVEGPVGRFDPGLKILFGVDEMEGMRRTVLSPAFQDVWQADLAYAARQHQVDAASMIRPYSLYAFTRYGRDSDKEIETIHDGIILALAGMITRNEDYMRQAARHAVALAHIDYWSEGFVDRFPGHFWYHSGFAPNVATIKASLLLDWTWHYLTPKGRAFVRKAVAEKGILPLQRSKNAMTNQGVRFNKGLILGKMALADSLDDPELQQDVRTCLDRINAKLDAIVRPDGTFSEGMGYGKGTMASTPISYIAASRCLGVPVKHLVTPRMLPAMRFVLEAERALNPAMASFCAGPLGDGAFASQCVPTGLLHDFRGYDLPITKYTSNRVEYIFFGLVPLWAPRMHARLQPPELPPFSVYRDGGWVFGGNEDPRKPRFSFESGLWDGHGHAWFHKHAITLDGWGERLLVTRFHLSYQDARSSYTMHTKLYNTFAPSARKQDASGVAGRGGKLTIAEDLGSLVVVESDNATAWRTGVKRAVRRVLFFRPQVMLVYDDVQLDKSEPGVQSWNSFHPWEMVGNRSCLSRAERAAVRLTVVQPAEVDRQVGQDSVSRERTSEGITEIPVYRAALTSPPATRHQMLTVIEVLGPGDDANRRNFEVLTEEGCLEIRQGDTVARVAFDGDQAPSARMHGFTTDGRLLAVVSRAGRPVAAGAFDATWLAGPDGKKRKLKNEGPLFFRVND